MMTKNVHHPSIYHHHPFTAKAFAVVSIYHYEKASFQYSICQRRGVKGNKERERDDVIMIAIWWCFCVVRPMEARGTHVE